MSFRPFGAHKSTAGGPQFLQARIFSNIALSTHCKHIDPYSTLHLLLCPASWVGPWKLGGNRVLVISGPYEFRMVLILEAFPFISMHPVDIAHEAHPKILVFALLFHHKVGGKPPILPGLTVIQRSSTALSFPILVGFLSIPMVRRYRRREKKRTTEPPVFSVWNYISPKKQQVVGHYTGREQLDSRRPKKDAVNVYPGTTRRGQANIGEWVDV
ncbi:hypothetical protein B0H11DRAFT_2094132 [Mycena galericulata]|nr:hypothetical protein B0H11DRAFT_2094132 [Mycena galericulata]